MRSTASTTPAIRIAQPSPGAAARTRSIRRRPIGAPASRAVTIVRTGNAPSHAQARPIAPKEMPIRKATGISTAPTPAIRAVVPGRPSALLTGANITCNVMNGMASASTATKGAISSHFAPNNVSTKGSAVTAMPR